MDSILKRDNRARATRRLGSDNIGAKMEAFVSSLSRTSGYVALILSIVGLVALLTEIV